jgi:hypothetical protein
VRALATFIYICVLLVGLFGQQRSPNKRHLVAKDSRLLDIYGDKAEQPWKLQQEKGDTGTGVVVSEQSGKLYLDIQPCEARVKTFSEPYEKEATGQTARCKGHELQLFYVRQK